MSGASRIRVVLCDDVEELRILLRHALEAGGDVEVVGEAVDGADGIARVRELQPDVTVIDVSMPNVDGLQAIPHLRRDAPACGIVVFSAFAAVRVGVRALEAGADRYLEKGCPLDDVLAAVREVAAARRRAA